MFSAEQVRELSIEVDRQLAAAREMPIADQKPAIDELRMLRSGFVGVESVSGNCDRWPRCVFSPHE